jgi:hypothetical protein
MTTAADDRAVEDAFEAYLAGRPVPEEAAGLAAFAGAVRATSTQPGRPSAALADLLATGLLTDQPSPSTRAARSAGSPPSRGNSRIRRRRRFTMIFPALLAKFLSAGALAQAATGAGVVLVTVTGAGAAGVLPAPVQDGFASVVATVTPLEAPTSEEDPVEEPTVEAPVAEEPTVEAPVAEEPARTAAFDAEVWLAGPRDSETFGEWVRQAAGNAEFKASLRAEGRNFGAIIRDWAQRKHMGAEDLAAEGVHLDELTEDGAEPTPVVEREVEAEVGPEPRDAGEQAATSERGNRGYGHGNGGSNGGTNGGTNGGSNGGSNGGTNGGTNGNSTGGTNGNSTGGSRG